MPKTIFDLINPKKQYKHQLEVPQPSDERIRTSTVRKIPKPLKDELEDLMVGAALWYKNARWIKGTLLIYSSYVLET